MARLSGRVTSLVRAMITSCARWLSRRLKAMAAPMASGSAVTMMHQVSSLSSDCSHCLNRVDNFPNTAMPFLPDTAFLLDVSVDPRRRALRRRKRGFSVLSHASSTA